MDKLARRGNLLPLRLRLTQWQADRLAVVFQPWHPVPRQYPSDRGAVQSRVILDPVRSQPARQPQTDEPPFGALR